MSLSLSLFALLFLSLFARSIFVSAFVINNIEKQVTENFKYDELDDKKNMISISFGSFNDKIISVLDEFKLMNQNSPIKNGLRDYHWDFWLEKTQSSVRLLHLDVSADETD